MTTTDKPDEYGQNNEAFTQDEDSFPPEYSTVVGIDRIPGTTDEKQKTEDDPWALVDPQMSEGTAWKDASLSEKLRSIVVSILKVCAVLVLLYFFICSIDLLAAAFQVMGGRTAGEAFTRSELLNNPVCGLIIGVIVTVLLQCSSTTISIVITMVAAQIIPVRQAIYIVMGANIGTSVTNTMVSMGQVTDRLQFRRAFAGATVHDMFNWLSVLILLPIEIMTGYLYYLTLAMVNTIDVGETIDEEPQFLKVITRPFVDLFVKVDKDVVYAIAEEAFVKKRPLTKYLCKEELQSYYQDFPLGTNVQNTSLYNSLKEDRTHPNYWVRDEVIEHMEVPFNETNMTSPDGSPVNLTRFSWKVPTFGDQDQTEPCSHLFVGSGLPTSYDTLPGWPYINMSESLVGGILLIMSLLLLTGCLVGMMKILKSLLHGASLKIVRKVINADITFPDYCPGFCDVIGRELPGYIAILTGAIVTTIIQSSSVFTSTLTPLVGMGVITVERMYPLTLGSNIGTTFTSLLAAFTSDPETIRDALQVSFAHLFFNISGVAIFYPVPFMRNIPILLAKKLGNITAVYRWFAIAYLIIFFCVMPCLIFALSIPGWYVLAAVLIPVLVIVGFVVIVNICQDKCIKCLPKRLQSWNWCPNFLCSLEPYDRVIKKCFSCCRCCNACQDDDGLLEETSSQEKHNIPDDVMQYKNGALHSISNGDVYDGIKPKKNFEVVNDENSFTHF